MSGMESGGYATRGTQRGNHDDSIRLAVSAHLRKRETGRNALCYAWLIVTYRDFREFCGGDEPPPARVHRIYIIYTRIYP